MEHNVPASVLLEISQCLRDARSKLAYPIPYEGSAYANVNRAEALVDTYLLAPLKRAQVTLTTKD